MFSKLLLAAAALLSATSSFAQFGAPRGPKCLEFGYTYGVAYAQYKYHNTSFDESTGKLTDTASSRNVTSRLGFGGLVGYYFPIVRVSANSRFAITLTYMYNAYLWEGSSFAISSDSRTGTSSVGSGTVEMALPVGIDYKTGCDANFDRSKRSCASFGAGVYPTFGATAYNGSSAFAFHARPYLKAEAGFFAGICFKLRATYVPGAIDYINYSSTIPGHDEGTSFRSRGTLNLSLILMPTSFKWSRSEWWGK